MTEPKYKINTKDRLARVAEDVQKVLGARGSAPAKAPAQGQPPPKKP